MSGVEAIETEYGGTLYRSRLEARWAVLFDLARSEYQYEPEGYKLRSGWYVPDFWIGQWSCFFEVKHENVVIQTGHYCGERSKAEDLTFMVGKDVLFGCGSPHPLMFLNRVPVIGLSPVDERLTDYIEPHYIAVAMKYRFDWAKPAKGGRIGDWEMLGLPSWRVMQDINPYRKRDDDR